jgi:hypothetical protein
MEQIKFTISQNGRTLSYEGSVDFLKNEFPAVFSQYLESEFWGQAQDYSSPADTSSNDGARGQNFGIQPMTMNTLCAKLDSKTGPDLILAACVHLTFFSEMDELPRAEIQQTMKDAKRYYKESYGSNFSSYLQTLVKQGKLMERSKEVYVLTPGCVKEMEERLSSL